MSEQNIDHRELLTFQLGDQEYAVDIMSVREIRGWTKTTPMPHAPAFVRGVINLRGTVLPVMDLAARLGLPSSKTTSRNVIIVVKCNASLAGLLVDSVSDIITLSQDDLQPPPDAGGDSFSNTLQALTLLDERMIRILEIENILSKSESAAA